MAFCCPCSDLVERLTCTDTGHISEMVSHELLQSLPSDVPPLTKLTKAKLGHVHVNPRFHHISLGWNLELTWICSSPNDDPRPLLRAAHIAHSTRSIKQHKYQESNSSALANTAVYLVSRCPKLRCNTNLDTCRRCQRDKNVFMSQAHTT